MPKVMFPEDTIVFGGSGMTGSYIADSVSNFDLQTGYDISERTVVEKIFQDYKPKVLIHLAAMTDVMECEKEVDKCFKTNALALYWICKLCRQYQTKLIFISSVDIFSGDKGLPYQVIDEPNPIVVYGHAKLAAECLIQGLLPDAVIYRAGWMFGGFEKDKKFVSYMVEQIKAGQSELRAVNDRVGSPTYAKDLINLVALAITDNLQGTFHICNDGEATRYSEALIIAEALGFAGQVIPVPMSEFPEFRSLKDARMTPSMAMRPWQEALREYLKEWQSRGL